MKNKNQPKKRRQFVATWKKRKKTIVITTGGVFATFLTLIGVKYYWNSTAFDRWFKKASLSELKVARHNIHTEFIEHRVNDDHRAFLENILSLFDKKINEVELFGKIPSPPTFHREHGNNLYKPD